MKKVLLLLLPLTLLVSCQNQLGCPDIQDNAILTDNTPDSDAYQTELVRLISTDEHEVKYYFEKREEGILILNVYGWGYCGQLHLQIKQEDEYSKKLQNEGGWRGAKLQGLKVELIGDRLVYKGMEGISD